MPFKILLQSGTSIITNCDNFNVLQSRIIVTKEWCSFFLPQNGTREIIKQGRYCKVVQIFQNRATFIKKWDRYYKVGEYSTQIINFRSLGAFGLASHFQPCHYLFSDCFLALLVTFNLVTIYFQIVQTFKFKSYHEFRASTYVSNNLQTCGV